VTTLDELTALAVAKRNGQVEELAAEQVEAELAGPCWRGVGSVQI
jgi:hypothetical protein